MTSHVSLDSSVAYKGEASPVRWEGRVVEDPDKFTKYMREVVRPRIADEESNFDTELRSLATTGMATKFLEDVLKAVPEPKSWEVGEALAECALQDDSGRQVCWPWNMVRDRRTPRASLPGADLVGFYRDEETVLLLFGEVKTSSDANTPPSVMSGGSGMTWQLEQSALRRDIQHSLLTWLQSRCRNQPYRQLYKRAVQRYLASEGKDLLLVGILIRDTRPNELDLKERANSLSPRLQGLGRIDLIAWYLPIRICDWLPLLGEV